MSENIIVSVVADSINPIGRRIVSVMIDMPKFAIVELMAFPSLSVFVRSADDKRIQDRLQAVEESPALLEFFGANSDSAGVELEGKARLDVMQKWRSSRFEAMTLTNDLHRYGLHRNIACRVLAPWERVSALVTSTDWDAFFVEQLTQKNVLSADMTAVTYHIVNAMAASVPNLTQWGSDHIPFDPGDCYDQPLRQQLSLVGTYELATVTEAEKRKLYYAALYENLQRYGHPSLFRHYAKAQVSSAHRSGSFTGGWLQYSKAVIDTPSLDYGELLRNRPPWITLPTNDGN